jgi:TPR repeat protein
MQHFARVQRIAELNMSDRASVGAVKRQREEEEEEEDAAASLQVAAHAEPLTLLAMFKSLYDMLVWAQLCNPQGVALFPFVHIPPRLRRPFAGAPVHGMSLTHAQRLCAVGCGLKGKLVRMLSLGVDRTSTQTFTTTSTVSTATTTMPFTGTKTSTTTTITSTIMTHHPRHFEPQRNWGACHKLMQSTVRRVASKLMAAVRDEAAKEAEELCASGQYAAAAVALKLAVDLGHLPSRALKAWLLVNGREGVAKDAKRGFELAEEGARLGCHHCQGVMAWCYMGKYGLGFGCVRDEARSLELARESSWKGSRYGQYVLGLFLQFGAGGVAQDYDQAVVFYRLAAAQNLDDAQYEMGMYFNRTSVMYFNGFGVYLDDYEGRRWHQLAEAQGYPDALFNAAPQYHDSDDDGGVVEAIRWFRRAQAAGQPVAAAELRRLRAKKPYLF